MELAFDVSDVLDLKLTHDQCYNRIHYLKREHTKHSRSGTLDTWEYGEKMVSLMKKGFCMMKRKIEKSGEGRKVVSQSKRTKIEKPREEKKRDESDQETGIGIALKLLGRIETDIGYLQSMSEEDQVKSMRDLMLAMAWRIKSHVSPITIKYDGHALCWNSHTIHAMIRSRHTNIRGMLECTVCGGVKKPQVDWREGFVNLGSYVLGHLYSAEFAPPLNGFDECEICSGNLRPLLSSAEPGYDWLFLAFTHRVALVPEKLIIEYLRAHDFEVHSETSLERVVFKFYVCILIQLDPSNGWRFLQQHTGV